MEQKSEWIKFLFENNVKLLDYSNTKNYVDMRILADCTLILKDQVNCVKLLWILLPKISSFELILQSQPMSDQNSISKYSRKENVTLPNVGNDSGSGGISMNI